MARLADPGLAERRRRQILDAALFCFRRRGFHQATMQELCAEAGISPGALYRYFSSKADIIAAIAEDEHREAAGVLAAECQQIGIIERLCALAEHFFNRCAEEGHGSIFADVVAEAARDPVLARRLMEIEHQRVARLAAALAAAQTHGEIDRALDPHTMAQILLDTMAGMAMRAAVDTANDNAPAVGDFRTLAARYLAVRA